MKIRHGYISNSSSSSFVIACNGNELADKTLDAYHKLVEYWKETHPNFDLNYFDTYYSKDTSKNIIENFSEYFDFTEIERKLLLKEWQEKEQNGFIFLYGTCSNEYDINGFLIMNMFNEYILNSLKSNNNQYEDLEIIFDRRGS